MSPSVTENNGLPVPIIHSRVVLLLSKRQAQRAFNCLRMPLPQAKHPIIRYFYQLVRTMICTIFLLNFSHSIICFFSELLPCAVHKTILHGITLGFVFLHNYSAHAHPVSPNRSWRTQQPGSTLFVIAQPQPSVAKARQEGRHLVPAI